MYKVTPTFLILLTLTTLTTPLTLTAPRDMSETLDLIYIPSSDSYSLQITIGTPPQSFECYLSTVLPKLYLPQYDSSGTITKSTSQLIFHPDSSSSYSHNDTSPISFPEISFSSEGYTSTDVLAFTRRHTLQKFNFITLTRGPNIDNTFSCSVGFEYMFKDPNDNTFSIINSLYDSNQIYLRLFYIIKNKHNSSFTFGKYPPKYNDITYRYQYKKCSLLISKTHPHLWQCRLNAMYFSDSNDVIQLDKALTWSFGGTVNCVDDAMYRIIKTKYFKNALYNDECEEVYNGDRTYLNCISSFVIRGNSNNGDNDNDDDDVTVSYIFGKWNMKFKLNEMFYKEDHGHKWFGLMKCEEGNSGFNWSIGMFHIKKGTFVFDKEQHFFAYSSLT